MKRKNYANYRRPNVCCKNDGQRQTIKDKCSVIGNTEIFWGRNGLVQVLSPVPGSPTLEEEETPKDTTYLPYIRTTVLKDANCQKNETMRSRSATDTCRPQNGARKRNRPRNMFPALRKPHQAPCRRTPLPLTEVGFGSINRGLQYLKTVRENADHGKPHQTYPTPELGTGDGMSSPAAWRSKLDKWGFSQATDHDKPSRKDGISLPMISASSISIGSRKERPSRRR